MSLPKEYRKFLYSKTKEDSVKKFLKNSSHIHTVCEEAKCPNRGLCFSKKTATFLIMGDICTRNCSFCAIKKGKPLPLDHSEIDEIYNAIEKLKLDYVVLTSVTRDDLSDGGASYFNIVLQRIKKSYPEIKTEILVPDFKQNLENLKNIDFSYVDVFNHNLETVRELYHDVRSKASYDFSLNMLKEVKRLDKITKSGIMVGLGEKDEQLVKLFKDLKSVSVDILTIGQYISPSPRHHKVVKYYSQEEFNRLKKIAEGIGIERVVSGIFVRSSFEAYETFKGLK
ncbi:MAG: Lipoyl synthase [candidate division TA06 bacterium 32_111]|uniref:Lipoyl synthase n=2 Tax=Bacteria candidate phyla TaxID=1783234 RepID=A0A101HZV5_UNCT6|nr:MAG: Lipoyl synthase [candidate division TA06 bacterium 32_111]KUK86148.1 MAG: Lipoyl synthase [candidate division TA06 bacterium 34_109]HAF06784.1 lipoyl synthase [candidate division WOR-3 bacterium]HCP17108.1 lipoyl synthase [candidate division WOR-3 bacterium]